MTTSQAGKREVALVLSEEILETIEMGNAGGLDVARRTSRLARLLDDEEAMRWLAYEITAYPSPLTTEAVWAALRSGRDTKTEDGSVGYWTQNLGELDRTIEQLTAQLVGLSGQPPSSGDAALAIDIGLRNERSALRASVGHAGKVRDRVMGNLHAYVAARHVELRFGAAIEAAFDVVRADVDRSIVDVLPDGLVMLSGAMENAVSANPEHWASAAATCRRLLKAVADALQPPGPDRDTGQKVIKMGTENYVNRLVCWFEDNMASESSAAVSTSDLQDLGNRLDAVSGAGNRGAHATVTRYEASRFIAGTYLLLGDILRNRPR